MRAVVKRFMREHPDLSYQELKDALIPKLGKRIVNDLESIKLHKDDGHVVVWKGDAITSSDGIHFKVYNQWQNNNFHKVLNFAKEMGYIDA